MKDTEPLVFDFKLAQGKPNSYKTTVINDSCPFCQVDNLKDIYVQKGEMIWLHNKFPTLQDTTQTIIIESGDHCGDITTYSYKYNRKLLNFALECFRDMNKQQFNSVLWYKNFGPAAGGSLVHPHMQIVGLKHKNGYKYISASNFSGISLFASSHVEVNIATQPVQGYIEININLLSLAAIDLWADWIQIAAKYLLTELANGRCKSYNLFFYPRNDNGICAKLIPRFVTSPYFVGYKLSQVDDNEKLTEEAAKLKNFFIRNRSH